MGIVSILEALSEDGDARRRKSGGRIPAGSPGLGMLQAPGGHLYVREMLEEVKKISPEAGAVLEKAANIGDAVENVVDAVNRNYPWPSPGTVDGNPSLLRLLAGDRGYSLAEARRKLHRGDHIYVYRPAYSHHGIYDGCGRVYHYNGKAFVPESAVIEKTSLEEFAGGTRIYRWDYKTRLTPDEIIGRAESRLGEQDYDLCDNNCERFAQWCRGLS